MSNLTLAITTIGDLLLNNKLSRDEQENSIEDVKLAIPKYQRPYKWTAKNALQLLGDIEQAIIDNKEVYRIGTLILHDDTNTHDEHSLNIVDGQQRTITLALLLNCLGTDKIPLLELELSKDPYSHRNIYYNYKAMERKLNRLTDDEKSKLLEYIKQRCELIVVITQDLSEAFQFFDSQNARGKKLYPHDLLKAFHLREMVHLDEEETEKVVETWEQMNQKQLSNTFSNYLYCIREWTNGEKATELTENNINLFKGISTCDKFPYAQFYKAAYAHCNALNHSSYPFVTGEKLIRPFQLDAPIIAGKPFFDYAKHYFDILADIRDNYNFEGYFIFNNEIIKTLDKYYNHGTGNRYTRRMLDCAILLYIDRFCPSIPSKQDTELLEQFVIYAFIWAYSLRAQYTNVGSTVAQNYIMGAPKKDGIKNAFNIYRLISISDSPVSLLSILASKMMVLDKVEADTNNVDCPDDDYIQMNYLTHFKNHKFWEGQK